MRYFAFSDIHGNKQLFNKIINYLNSLQEEYVCYYLGDACDRGKDGYYIMRQLLKKDSKIRYLKGDHEDLFVQAANALREQIQGGGIIHQRRDNREEITNFILSHAQADENIMLHLQNGGLTTLIDWIFDWARVDIIQQVNLLPKIATFTLGDKKFELTHAGHRIGDYRNILWDRSHFFQTWNEGVMVHGHTPVASLKNMFSLYEKPSDQALIYENDTKICIDVGTYNTKTACLFDLENQESICFKI